VTRSPGQIGGAAVTGGLIGGVGGAAIGGALVSGGAVPAAVAGAIIAALVAAVADAHRVPGRPQPLPARILFASLVAAGAGSVLQWLLPDWSAAVPSVVLGLVSGMSGGRPAKALLGAAVGAVVGLGFDAAAPEVGWAVPSAVTVAVYRSIAAVVWHGREQLRIRAESLPADRVRYVVPFAEATRYVGVDYLQRYAESVGADFARRPADIGILASIDALAGPRFDPALVHPLVREFYEHTSRFHLAIVPEWRWWMRLPYRIYRRTIARPLGQANAPFEVDEVQRGVISWIDTIDVDHDGVADFRAWVRAYEATNEPLYVGIYTVVSIDDTAYVSVGFPLPAGSFTATLLPSNHRGDGLLLSSDPGDAAAGHYLSVIEEGGGVTTIQLTSFGEQIDVYVENGRLLTEQTFTLGGAAFLTLHYQIGRV
jgi:hypothetical protein